jgi:hypothetical protein
VRRESRRFWIAGPSTHRHGASLRSSHRSIARASIAGLGRSRHFRRPPALRNTAALVVLSGWFWSPSRARCCPAGRANTRAGFLKRAQREGQIFRKARSNFNMRNVETLTRCLRNYPRLVRVDICRRTWRRRRYGLAQGVRHHRHRRRSNFRSYRSRIRGLFAVPDSQVAPTLGGRLTTNRTSLRCSP